MSFHPILAHGAFGNWDEVVFLSVAAIFLFMMGFSWVRSRTSTPTETENPAQPAEAVTPEPEPDKPDHFTLS